LEGQISIGASGHEPHEAGETGTRFLPSSQRRATFMRSQATKQKTAETGKRASYQSATGAPR